MFHLAETVPQQDHWWLQLINLPNNTGTKHDAHPFISCGLWMLPLASSPRKCSQLCSGLGSLMKRCCLMSTRCNHHWWVMFHFVGVTAEMALEKQCLDTKCACECQLWVRRIPLYNLVITWNVFLLTSSNPKWLAKPLSKSHDFSEADGDSVAFHRCFSLKSCFLSLHDSILHIFIFSFDLFLINKLVLVVFLRNVFSYFLFLYV